MLCGSYSLMIRSPLWFGEGANQWWMLRAWYVRRLILRPFEPIDRLTLTSHTPPSLIRRCYQLLQMTDADTNNMHVGIPLEVCFHSPTGTYMRFTSMKESRRKQRGRRCCNLYDQLSTRAPRICSWSCLRHINSLQAKEHHDNQVVPDVTCLGITYMSYIIRLCLSVYPHHKEVVRLYLLLYHYDHNQTATITLVT